MREIRAARPEETDELCAMAGAGFEVEGEADWVRHLMATEPGFAPWQSRVAVVGGRIVSLAQVLLREIRYGQARLPMAGIANVCTLPEQRGRGHARAAIEDGLALARQQGCVIGMLFTDIPGYYHRQGWARVDLPAAAWRPLDQLPPLSPAVQRLRGRLARRDLVELAAIHDSAMAGRVGPLVRPPWYWQSRWGRGGHGDLLRTDHAYLAAGVREEERALAVYEGGCYPGAEEELRALLAAAARLTGERGQELLVSVDQGTVPPELWQGLGEPVALPADRQRWFAMVRVLDLPALLAAMRPELERRWSVAGRPNLDCTLAHRGRSAALVTAGGRLDARPGLGGQGLDDEAAVSLCFGRGAAGLAPGLEGLFPGERMVYWPGDAF